MRRSKVEPPIRWYRRMAAQLGRPSTLMALLAAALTAVLLNLGEDPVGVRVGQRLAHPLTARVPFRVEDDQQTAALRIQARDNSPNYYRLDSALLDDIRGRLINALTLARAHGDDPQRVVQEAAKNRVVLDEAAVAELLRLSSASVPEPVDYLNAVDATIRELAAQPLVERAEPGVRRTAVQAVLVDEERRQQRRVPSAELKFPTTPAVVEEIAQSAVRGFPEALRASMARSLALMLRGDSDSSARPLYRYDLARSMEMAEQAYRDVPTQYITYARNTVLAEGLVSADELRLLEAEQQAYRQADPTYARQQLWAAVGRGVLGAVIVLGLAFYLTRCLGRELLARPLPDLATAIMLLGMLEVARLTRVSLDAPQMAVGAQALAAGVLAIAFARSAALATCGALALLIALATGQGLGFYMMLLAVAGVLVFGLRDVRSRGRIVAVGTAAAAVALLITLAAGLAQHQPLTFAARTGLWAAGSTLAAAFILEGLLPAVERLFGLSTNMTLLEWCDANKPLLRMMAADAPGTYNHSLLVGALAEKAADAIGANGLLARAGAYYHDIGKINKPEYFVENQAAAVSRHERLSPAMSLLIIVGHVKDGVEIAREYGLPPVLQNFIREHHGTTLVEYFYHAASKARKPGDPEIPETEFRYPGPKPQSRETAIVMLCDAVEGAVRAMPEPTPGRIEALVREIIHKRLIDGQLDECDLSFRELAAIEKSMVKSLNAIYHARIVYPEPAAQPARPASA